VLLPLLAGNSNATPHHRFTTTIRSRVVSRSNALLGGSHRHSSAKANQHVSSSHRRARGKVVHSASLIQTLSRQSNEVNLFLWYRRLGALCSAYRCSYILSTSNKNVWRKGNRSTARYSMKTERENLSSRAAAMTEVCWQSKLYGCCHLGRSSPYSLRLDWY
jgi:hypothetical protein